VFGRVAIDSEYRYYFFCLAVLVCCVFAVRGLRRSRIGRVLVAVRENDRAVQAFGVNVVRAKLTAFAVSGFLAAVAGVLLVHLQHALYPGGVSPVASLSAFIMVVIGGLGSMTGVFVGAIYLNGLSWIKTSMPTAIQPLLQLMGSGIGLMLILMVLPGGVGSVLFRARDSLLRRVADRRGIVVPSLVADKRVVDIDPDAVDLTPAVVVAPPTAPAEVAEALLEPVGAGVGEESS
jgi:branched-chain amino acid transport system permease protein